MPIHVFAPAWLFALAQAPATTAPPGLVLIPKGQTWIGTERSEVEQVGKEDAGRVLNLAPETPQFQRQVDAFYLGVTEVTNEQYAEYIKATGHRPPDSWGMKAIDDASTQYSADIGTKKKEARDAGRPTPDFPKFDQVQWWNDHWREAAWEVPPGSEALPVGYVDYREAQNYAHWCGMRLMSEFEFQRAARGSTKNSYPWGDKWDPLLCASGGQGLKSAQPVGSYPGGKTAQGIYDLSGNVWEWTSSPFVEYPGFKVIQVRRKDETIDAVVSWDASQRVVVGGSYQERPSAARVTTRRPTDTTQSAEALGLRLAASTLPGLDIASAVLSRSAEQLPDQVHWDPTKAALCDSWRTAKGKSEVPGYSVITAYDYVVFVPAVDLEFTSLGQVDQRSLATAPVAMGVLATSQPMLQPQLPAGAYTVALRGPGGLKDHESIRAGEAAGAAEPPAAPAGGKQSAKGQEPPPKGRVAPIEYPAGFVPTERNLLFYDKDRRVAAALPVTEAMEFVTPHGTSAEIVKGELGAGPSGAAAGAVSVKLRVNTWVKVSNKAIGFTLPLWFKEGAVTPEWRK